MMANVRNFAVVGATLLQKLGTMIITLQRINLFKFVGISVIFTIVYQNFHSIILN